MVPVTISIRTYNSEPGSIPLSLLLGLNLRIQVVYDFDVKLTWGK